MKLNRTSMETCFHRIARTDTAKLFVTARSQAVRLPRAYRFEGEEVFIRRDRVTGDVVLSR